MFFDLNTNCYGKHLKGSKNWVCLPKTRDFPGGTVKNTGRSLRMLPLVFQELSCVAVFRFSSHSLTFVHIASSEGNYLKSSKIRCTSGPISDFQSFVCPFRENWLTAPEIKLMLWGNGKVFKKSLGKLRGAL